MVISRLVAVLSGVMRLFGWETTFGYGSSSGSDPDSLEAEGGVNVNMELTPERREAISQVSVHTTLSRS